MNTTSAIIFEYLPTVIEAIKLELEKKTIALRTVQNISAKNTASEEITEFSVLLQKFLETELNQVPTNVSHSIVSGLEQTLQDAIKKLQDQLNILENDFTTLKQELPDYKEMLKYTPNTTNPKMLSSDLLDSIEILISSRVAAQNSQSLSPKEIEFLKNSL